MNRVGLLTPTQQEIMALVCLGYSNRKIAVELSITPSTVKTHLQACYSKLGLRRPVEGYNPRVLAALYWRRNDVRT